VIYNLYNHVSLLGVNLCSGELPAMWIELIDEQLGEYMLKGWTMTDLVCHHCRTTPLMREPTSEATAAGRSDAQRIQFCGRCDGSPHGSCALSPSHAVSAD
jgi:hypothetical protein